MKPFFIVGAPRSGTTLLRDLFKQVRDVYSPEETHFFRWACPLRGNEFDSINKNNKILGKHRSIDGIDDAKFHEILASSRTKRELTDAYCSAVAKGKGKKFWFEKTPQNVYGLPLIADQYEEEMIIHIVRHPHQVVKSLLLGKVLKVDDVVGAANYWYEAVAIVNTMKPYLGERLVELKYEDLLSRPIEAISSLCEKVGIDGSIVNTKDVVDRGKGEPLSPEHAEVVNSICEKYMRTYRYDVEV